MNRDAVQQLQWISALYQSWHISQQFTLMGWVEEYEPVKCACGEYGMILQGNPLASAA